MDSWLDAAILLQTARTSPRLVRGRGEFQPAGLVCEESAVGHA